MKLEKVFHFSLLFLNIFNVLDFIVTFIGVNRFGIVAEGNLFLAFIIVNFGWVFVFIVKIISLFLFSLFLDYPLKKISKYKEFVYFIYSVFVCYMIVVFVFVVYEWLVILV